MRSEAIRFRSESTRNETQLPTPDDPMSTPEAHIMSAITILGDAVNAAIRDTRSDPQRLSHAALREIDAAAQDARCALLRALGAIALDAKGDANG